MSEQDVIVTMKPGRMQALVAEIKDHDFVADDLLRVVEGRETETPSRLIGDDMALPCDLTLAEFALRNVSRRGRNRQMRSHAGIVAPDERLSWPQTLTLGVQHVVAMFGATVLAPLLMGFDPNVAILMSGVGTLLFFVITGGRVPSYLGSSFAFIGVVVAATAYAGHGLNPNIAVALGGIVACGAFSSDRGSVFITASR